MLSWTSQQWAVLLTAQRLSPPLPMLCQQLRAAPGLGVWVLGVIKPFAQNFNIPKGKTEVIVTRQMRIGDLELIHEWVKTFGLGWTYLHVRTTWFMANERVEGYGLNCLPPNFICWSPNPEHLRMWLYLEIGPFRGNEGKTRSFGGLSPDMTGVPVRGD